MPIYLETTTSDATKGQVVDFVVQFSDPDGRTRILGVVQVSSNGLILADARDTVVKMLERKGMKKSDMVFGPTYDTFTVPGGGRVQVSPLQPLEKWLHVILESARSAE